MAEDSLLNQQRSERSDNYLEMIQDFYLKQTNDQNQNLTDGEYQV